MTAMELVKSLNRNINNLRVKKLTQLGFNSDLKHAIEKACACFGFGKVGVVCYDYLCCVSFYSNHVTFF